MNDLMASNIYRIAREKSLRVGKDIPVIGFDNRERAPAHEPPLTSIDIPLEIGHAAASTMLDILVKNTVSPTQYIPCELIVRQSVANIAQK